MQNVFLPADVLLPKKNFENWAVIACDQYTSDAEYWDAVKKSTDGNPSALDLIFPEVYLGNNDAERIEKINSQMINYVNENVFDEYKECYIYLVRTLKDGSVRKGIVGKIDLECYDFNKGSSALIRATEATVLSRIPPRVKIRENATLELPHVMLLADDPDNKVFSVPEKMTDSLPAVYDFDLMLGSGHVTGYLIDGEKAALLQSAFDCLVENDGDKLMFAVGDGNHSLATAKTCYQNNPTELNRYALAEVVNIHDSSLNFEPIYRVLFDVEPEKFIDGFVDALGGMYCGADAQKFLCVFGESRRTVSVRPTSKLSVGTLQKYLDEQKSDVKIDYIHDEEAVYKLCKQSNTLGFIFDSMKKSELFDAVKMDGALPRKTFSMGHADDKRFYVESRKIK